MTFPRSRGDSIRAFPYPLPTSMRSSKRESSKRRLRQRRRSLFATSRRRRSSKTSSSLTTAWRKSCTRACRIFNRSIPLFPISSICSRACSLPFVHTAPRASTSPKASARCWRFLKSLPSPSKRKRWARLCHSIVFIMRWKTFWTTVTAASSFALMRTVISIPSTGTLCLPSMFSKRSS